jgi:hypothetical protein
MRLPSAWKAIIKYWLPEQALTGERPVSLVKSLLSGCVMTKTLLDGIAMGGGRTTSGTSNDRLGFVDQTF